MIDERFQIENGVLVRYNGEEEKVIVPDGVTAIGDRAFDYCDTITEVILPNSVISIGERAFMKCSWLTKIGMPNTLEFIGNAAFRGCDSLERIELPVGLSILPNACFYECINLKSAILPIGINRICLRAFSGCSSLVSINLPDELTKIEECAFEHCNSLQSVILPDSLMYIGRHAFASCYKLSEIKIPKSVKSIGSGAFYQTAFLDNSDSEFVIGGDGILISCISEAENIIVPAGVKKIGERAFAYNEHIRNVIFSDGVSEICNNAFERCKALSDILLTESLRIIGDRAFEECSSLVEISLPTGITQIGVGVFEYTPIADWSETLILNDKYLIAYRDNEKYPQIPDTVEVIAGGAFFGNTDIKAVELNGRISSICKEAFRWCRNLEKVHISSNVQYIGEYAFAGCDDLHAYIECSQRIVEENAFESGCWITFIDEANSFTVQLKNNLTAESHEQALFDFTSNRIEINFEKMYIPEYRLPVSICYAKYNIVYEKFLRENIVAAVCMAVDRTDSELLRCVLEYGFLTESQSIECAAYAIEHKAIEQQVIIMRYKQDSFGAVSDEIIDSRFDW